MKRLLSLILAAGLFTATLPASSHHSFPAAFDVSELVFLEGEVTNFMFRNPHSITFMDVKKEDSTTESWFVAMPPAWALVRMGIVKDFIKVGDKLLFACNPARDGTNSCGLGQNTGFYRHKDTFLYGKDPRKAMEKEKGKLQ
jgi:hypothetical protein